MNNYAVSSDGIATALQDSASALMEAGNNLEQSVALVAAANKVVQDPNSVGSALRTISLRLRGTSVSILEEMGEETDGVVESVSKMQEKIKALTGVDILTENGAYKETYEILREIGTVWEDMSDIDQAALLELMAGKNRANTLAAILGNLEDLEGAYESAMQAENSALRENEKYLDSIQGRIDLFTNSVQSMWMNAISSDFIKFIVDAGTGLINLIDKFGLFQSLIGGFLGFNVLKSIVNIDDFKTIGSWIKELIKDQEILTTSGQKLAAEIAAVGIRTKLETSSLIQYAIANKLVQAEQIKTMTTTELLGASFQALIAKIWGAITALGKFLFTTPLGLAIVGITAAVAAYEILITTHEEYLEQLDEQTEKLQTVRSELKDLQSELETTKDRIAELEEMQKNKTLSFVEEEELNRLREQNDELERQQKILESKEKHERNKQVELALNAIKGDPDEQNVSPYSNNVTTIMQHAAVTGSMDLYAYTQSYAAGLQEPVQSSNKYENALNSLKEAYIELEAAEKKMAATDPLSKDFKSASDAVDAAQKKVDTFNTSLYNLYDAWEADYGEVGFITDPITASEEEWNEYYRKHQNYKYQQGLINGDFAESDVLGYVFGYTATDLAKAFNESFNSALESGENPSQVIANLLADEKYAGLLAEIESNFGITADTISAYFTQVGETIAAELQAAVSSVQTYSVLSESVSSYKELLSQTEEIATDNIAVTQEYREELIKLVGDTEEVNKCFDENNKLIVKDAKALNNLVKSAKKNTAQNIKLAKSQARLEYYELYKEMRQLTNGTEVSNAATLRQINALYEQMSVVQRTISKYSLLEAELLGTANAYQELADAQAADEAMDYGTKAEELVNVLAEAFNTSELGTEAARVAIEGLIPDDVIDKSKTLDEQMQQIYDYFTDGEISKLFTIEFDEEGAIKSVEMTKENIQKFTESLIGTDSDSVFQGTWDEFTLNPAIQTLEDFAKACGVTEEIAFSFLTSLEKYDIANALGAGGDTLLDQLMGDNVEYQLQKIIETAAKAEKRLAEGLITADSQEYREAQRALEEQEEKILTDTTSWARKQSLLAEQKDKLVDLEKQYKKAYEAGEDTSNIEQAIENTSSVIDTLIADLGKLDEPTTFVLEVAKSEAEENIAEFKEELAELVDSGDERAIKINAFVEKIDTAELDGLEALGFIKGEDGVWRGSANIEGWSSLDPASKQQVLNYINQIEGEHQIDVLLGQDTPTVEEHLATIAKVLEDIAKLLDPTYTLTVETSDAERNAISFKSIWDSIKDKAVTLYQSVVGSNGQPAGANSGSGAQNGNGTDNAHGSWGAPKTETSLVGELGPEILVRGHRWTTVGDNGAEFTQVKKGDIIFNH